ncbi:MAG: hypothetical protein ACYTFX_09545 [Planctomycetota bacterium]|jgi:hypothetical protein
MTKREIASLAIKLMGVFILIRSISSVPVVFYAWRPSENIGFLQSVLMLLLSILLIIIPLVIIRLADRVAVWLIKDDTHTGTIVTSISKDDIMIMAVSCIGLYFIITAIPSLVMNLSFYFRLSASSFWQNAFRTLVAPAVQLGLGVWLFVGSRGIVKLWKKIRS